MNRIRNPRCLQVIIYLMVGLGFGIYSMHMLQLLVLLTDPIRVISSELLMAVKKYHSWVGMITIASIGMLIYFMVTDWLTR